jgi:hypothetical protein
MVNLRKTPNQQNTFAASAALLVLAGISAAPALAATASQINCPIASVATLDVPFQGCNVPAVVEDEAIEEIEFTSSESLLAPRAEAAIRNAFKAGTEAKTKTLSADENDKRTEADATMSTKLPGISDADFARYKKQMYRRDI